jgi:hypothetical protein
MCNGDLSFSATMWYSQPRKKQKKKQKLDNEAGKMAEYHKRLNTDQQCFSKQAPEEAR